MKKLRKEELNGKRSMHTRSQVTKWAYQILVGVNFEHCKQLKRNRKQFITHGGHEQRVIQLSEAVDYYLGWYFGYDQEIENEVVVEILDRKNFFKVAKEVLPGKLMGLIDNIRVKGHYDVDVDL